MNILARHTLRSIGRNKLQAAVIFLTVVAVTMMIFAAFSMTGVFYNINVAEYKRTAGDSDMLVGDRAGGAPFARAIVENLARENDEIVSVDYFFRASSVLHAERANYPIFVEATDLATFATPENGFYLVGETLAGEYPSALVSERFASEYGVSLGAVVEILSPVTNQYLKFNVTHLLETKGFFGSAVTNQIVVDLGAIDSMGLVNNAYLTFRDPALYDDYAETVRKLLPTANVERALNVEEVVEIASNNTLLLTAAVVFITLVMMLILFSSYLIISRTRMSEMVLMKAAGASPAQAALILLTEVLCYGVAGSFLGVLLGRIVMGAAVQSLLPYATAAVGYEFWKFLAAFLIGVAVSVVSALFPMLSVAKKSIRTLTQGAVKEVKRKKPWVAVVSTAIVAGFAVALGVLTGDAQKITLFVSIPFLVLWLVTALGFAVRIVAKIAALAFRSGGGALGAKTAKRSGHILSVATLVAVVSAFAFTVVSIIDVVVIAVTPYNSRFSADVVVTSQQSRSASAWEACRARFSALAGVDGVESFGTLNLTFDSPDGASFGECSVIAVSDGAGIFKVSNRADASLQAAFDRAERPLVLNYDVAERFSLNVGDKVVLSETETLSGIKERRGLDGAFTVVGIEYTATEWDRVAIVRASDLTSGGVERPIAGGLFIDAEDVDAAYRTVRAEAERDGAMIALRYNDWYAASSKGLEGVSALLRFAEALFAFIAALGVLNVSIVTFLDRKRESAVYRLVGMDTAGFFAFRLTEGAIAALSGAATGLIAAFFINRLMPVLANLVSKFLAVPLFPPAVFAVPFLTGGIFFLLWIALTAAFGKNFRSGEFRFERSTLQ